ncbi:MAG: RNA polymerase sigma-70 factor [Cyclobacteriaceae bacterium]|nr:RNA polymerase sigma-70 factor [Cyclobacteriaceae bacterium]
MDTGKVNELVQWVKQGDEKAFRQLYDHYWSKLYVKAYQRLSDAYACEEILQSIFIRFWQKRDVLEITHSLDQYFYAALRFEIINWWRHHEIKEKHLEYFKKNSETVVHEDHDISELQNILNSKIARLPSKCRKAFGLSRFEHQTNQQIADQMGITIKTVEYHITFALRQLKSEMKDYTYFLLIGLLFV